MFHLILAPIAFTGSYFVGRAIAHAQYERSRRNYLGKVQMSTFGKTLFDLELDK